MYFTRNLQIKQKICQHDGYRSELIWRAEDENASTYDNIFEDSQCCVPIEDIYEVAKKLEKTKK